ncbi:MAG TPA: hypothetical protein ENK57_21245 [Polyangiaceae bacterium]|nr:hypothetical protein [Polyangiaceae bacterium]
MTTRWRRLALAGAVAGLCAVAACSGSGGSGETTSGGGNDASGGGISDGGAGGSVGTGGSGTGVTDPCDGVMCPAGEVCEAGACVMGCMDTMDCAMGDTCCGGACVDIGTSVDHCGGCGSSCPELENQAVTCQMGICNVGACDMGFFDCDGMAGCESSEPCSCTPGATQPCYPGPPGTEGQGQCQGGTQKCNAAGTAWGLCNGFVLPSVEICANNIDEDCTGVADDVPDIDGDGWTACDNDCCETMQDCSTPGAVNPGAFEFVGNMIDDDCDPSTSDATAVPACSTAADFTAITAQQMAEAMDICQTTTVNAPLPTKKWGLIDASFRRADGSNPSAAELNEIAGQQTAILVNYGTGGVVPQLGPTMAGMSSGRMRDQNDPSYVNPNSGTNLGNASQPPAAYLAANGGSLPASQSCNGTCPAGAGANDSVNLRLEIRVPTNAQSFAYQFRFFSSEYWTYSCTQYNDFYLTQYTSLAPGIPADKNISFDSLSNPVSVNNGFFELCVPKGCYTCPNGTGELAGTGMQLGNTGGGTVWLQTTAPVVPGETMVLEMMVFDVSDNILDSLVLLDAFEWSINPSGVGTGPPG